MSKKYMMDVYDVMEELGVSKSKAYQILRELNAELIADGFKALEQNVVGENSIGYTLGADGL